GDGPPPRPDTDPRGGGGEMRPEEEGGGGAPRSRGGGQAQRSEGGGAQQSDGGGTAVAVLEPVTRAGAPVLEVAPGRGVAAEAGRPEASAPPPRHHPSNVTVLRGADG